MGKCNPSPVDPTPGKRLKYLRTKNGLSQNQLCDLLGKYSPFSKSRISAFENGHQAITERSAEILCEAFPGTRSEWLLCRDEFETEDDFQNAKKKRDAKAERFVSNLRGYHNAQHTLMDLSDGFQRLVNGLGFDFTSGSDDDGPFYDLSSPDGKRVRISKDTWDGIFTSTCDYLSFLIDRTFKASARQERHTYVPAQE